MDGQEERPSTQTIHHLGGTPDDFVREEGSQTVHYFGRPDDTTRKELDRKMEAERKDDERRRGQNE